MLIYLSNGTERRSLNLIITWKSIRKHSLFIVIQILLLYLIISGWNYYDVRYFIKWYEEYVATGRLLEVYTVSPPLKVAYPPLAILIFSFFHALVASFFPTDIIAWRIIDKLPLLISFNIVYFILYRKYGNLASILWLFNFVAYSVIHSYQFDLIVSLFILMAIISIGKEDYEKYGIYTTLATLIKHTLGILLLLPIIELLQLKDHRRLSRYLAVIFTIGFVFIFPFFIVDPVSFIDKVLLFHAKRPPQQLSIWAIPAYLAKYDLSRVPEWLNNAWIIPFTLFTIFVFYMFTREDTSIPKENKYIKYIILLITGFLLLSKVNNINYFLWIAPPLIILISKLYNTDEFLARKLSKLYLFTSFIISVLFGFFTVFAQLVVGYPIFMFEDWTWIPVDEFFVRGYAYEPFNTAFVIALYFRSIPAFRETFKSIALTHHYFLVLLCILYAYALCYFMYTALNYPYREKRFIHGN